MANYGAKYDYTFTANGERNRLLISQKNYTGAVTPLDGLIQGIRIQRLGDNLIESPITKSALAFTLVDRDGGMWEEFFTPDATEYKVEFITDQEVRWAGYITPDSYEEDLIYRGSISVTARDMLGHMADIPFVLDFPLYNNMVNVKTLVRIGLEKAECAMDLDFNATGERIFIKDIDTNASCGDWVVDARGLEGKNWYEVIEGLLDSLGLVMRWEEANKIVVTSIEDVPLGGMPNADTCPEYDVQFWNRSGHRTLEPAFRMIDEVLTYNIKEEELSEWGASAFDAQEVLLGENGWRQNLDNRKVMGVYSADTFPTEFADVSEEDEAKYVLLYATPESDTSTATFAYRRYVMSPFTKCKVSFNIARLYSSMKTLDWALGRGKLPHGEMEFDIQWITSSETYHLKDDGTWTTDTEHIKVITPLDASSTNSRHMSTESSMDIEKSFTTPSEEGVLQVDIYAFKHRLRQNVSGAVDTATYWIRLGNVTLSVDTKAMPKDMKVKTTYDMKQNYTLTRKPMFGKTPAKVTSAGVILNGFYKGELDTRSVQRAFFGSGATYPLPVVVDMEILSRHLRTTSVITGTIADTHGSALRMNGIWWYGNKLMILQAGSLDPMRGCIDGAILREFITDVRLSATDYEIK